MPIIYQQVSYSYDNNRTFALQETDLTINEGEFVCIIGHTGSGKSTFADQMSAVVYPTQGSVLVDGMNTHDTEKRTAIRKLIGQVIQYPEYQLFANSVYEDIAFGPTNQGLSLDEVDERVTYAAQTLDIDLAQLGDKSPFDISGGQQRRVAIAGIIAMKPKYLILDEPMAGLDPEGQDLIRRWLIKLKDNNQTVIMITHSMDDAAQLADRVLVMKSGKIVQDGDPRTIFSDHAYLSSINLSAPQATLFAIELLSRAQARISQGSGRPFDYEISSLFANNLPITLDELSNGIALAHQAGEICED